MPGSFVFHLSILRLYPVTPSVQSASLVIIVLLLLTLKRMMKQILLGFFKRTEAAVRLQLRRGQFYVFQFMSKQGSGERVCYFQSPERSKFACVV